jgi:hypothetical protein
MVMCDERLCEENLPGFGIHFFVFRITPDAVIFGRFAASKQYINPNCIIVDLLFKEAPVSLARNKDAEGAFQVFAC